MVQWVRLHVPSTGGGLGLIPGQGTKPHSNEFMSSVMSDSLWLADQASYPGFSRKEYWSGLPFPSPGDLLHPGIKPESLIAAGWFFTAEPSGNPKVHFEMNRSYMLQLKHPVCHVAKQTYIYLFYFKSPLLVKINAQQIVARTMDECVNELWCRVYNM